MHEPTSCAYEHVLFKAKECSTTTTILSVNAVCDPRTDRCDSSKGLWCDTSVYQCRYKTIDTTVQVTAAASATDGTVAATSTTSTTIHDPDNVDCIEKQDACTVACYSAADRNYTVLTLAAKRGKACTGPTDCRPGDGACPTASTPATNSSTTTPPTASSMGTTIAIICAAVVLVVAIVWLGVRRAQTPRQPPVHGRRMPPAAPYADVRGARRETAAAPEYAEAAPMNGFSTSTAVETVMNAMYVEPHANQPGIYDNAKLYAESSHRQSALYDAGHVAGAATHGAVGGLYEDMDIEA